MKKTFDKVLVANRGEIAVRVIRAVQEAGMKAVAVYSDADRDALHVRCADEAYHIGPPTASRSYLVAEKLLDVCRRSGAQAVHPGYGFLSENADFARSLDAAGLTFIGPPPGAIDAMGFKTRARDLMRAAGVPVVPGSDGAIEDPDQALIAAREIGFPVLAKAAAGGGGKGMRRIDAEEGFQAAFNACRREALNAFGDGNVYLEKFVVDPRHVEIQVLADQHGNVRHLFERDCSIQRRHQKVIEETPCPVLRDDVRQAMGQVAVRAAEAVDYVGAGTVEFLLDADQNFYFLEMNTRLQVEHPITEMITGVDLVRAQLDVARGLPITWAQDELKPRGASIQCRVYAEDPAQGFMPSPGLISLLRAPSGPFVRNDAGFESGDRVPVHYDPLVSKLVVWGEDRDHAIRRMRRALTDYVVDGIRTNIAFHLTVLDDPGFCAGDYSTHFIAERQARDQPMTPPLSDDDAALARIAATLHAHLQAQQTTATSAAPSRDTSAWRMLSRMRRLNRA